MNRTRVTAGVLVCSLLLAGCLGDPTHGVEIGDPSTEITVSGAQATWTWSARIEPPPGQTRCDVPVHVTLTDETGAEVVMFTRVLADVRTDPGPNATRRSVAFVGNASVVRSVDDYELSVGVPECRDA